jgi:hypothetical protein
VGRAAGGLGGTAADAWIVFGLGAERVDREA